MGDWLAWWQWVLLVVGIVGCIIWFIVLSGEVQYFNNATEGQKPERAREVFLTVKFLPLFLIWPISLTCIGVALLGKSIINLNKYARIKEES